MANEILTNPALQKAFTKFLERAARAAARGAKPTLVDLGAGEDLGASIYWARRGAYVTAVEPGPIREGMMGRLESLGATVIRGRSGQVAAQSADHVIINFPYRITGSGRWSGGLTHEAAAEGLRIARPGGVVTLVTEDKQTALAFLRQVNSLRPLGAENVEVLSIKVPARIAAPGSSGIGVPNFSPNLEVHLINLYIPGS